MMIPVLFYVLGTVVLIFAIISIVLIYREEEAEYKSYTKIKK